MAVAALSLFAMACAPQPGGGGTATTTTTTSTLPWTEPTGQWFGFNLTCYFNVFGQSYNFPQFVTANIDAPATVPAGDTFTMVITPGPYVVPTEVQGFALQQLQYMTIRYPLPDNVNFVDSIMTAGIDSGPGYPSLKVENGYLVYRVPGPFTPGATVQMPGTHVYLEATGIPGSFIETRFQSLSSTAVFGLATVGSTCLPDNPGTVFTTTEII